jgi:CRISPR/Cas system-associated exonuclease Cas4 (RecB family)
MPNPQYFPPDFQFSQHNLNDFVACQRRFQLRHLLRQAWPAPLVEPIREAEAHRRHGEQFHKLIERHYLGLNPQPPKDPALAEWWSLFQNSIESLNLPDTILRPEMTCSIPFPVGRLMARFDLVAINPGESVVIVDWKTGRRPEGKNVDNIQLSKMQTVVYLVVAQEALTHEFGGAIPAAALKLYYWYTEAPHHPIELSFKGKQGVADLKGMRVVVERLMEQIVTLATKQGLDQEWKLTDNLQQCRFCNYRTLCKRNVTPITLEEAEVDELIVDALSELEEIPL